MKDAHLITKKQGAPMKLSVKNVLFLMLMAAFLSGCATSSALAGDRPNLLIMGEDADSDSLPRDSRVFKRVLNAIAIQLQDIGFDVYDESVVTHEQFSQGRIRRDRQALIDIGQRVRHPPIDVVVSFTIYASLQDKGHTHQINARVEAQMVQVNSGRFLGSFEVSSPKAWSAPAECDRDCVLERVGGYAKILANDLGAVLAQKLAFLVDGSLEEAVASDNGSLVSEFHLIFDNFSPEQIMSIEEYLVVFSGYHSHRPTYASARRAELWYQSDIESARLLRNLHKMLDRLGLYARVSYSGNTFSIEQTVIMARKSHAAVNEW
jgi:hypothetical protein